MAEADCARLAERAEELACLGLELERFGPGAIVRAGAGGPNTRRQSVLTVMPDGSAVTTLTPVIPGDDADRASPAGAGDDDAPGVVIARRLQQRQGMARRMNMPPPSTPTAEDAALQDLREAFLNARLAERWRCGEAWARLDLAGLELQLGVDHGGRAGELGAALAELRGDAAAQAALDQLRAEWDHLRRLRQKYVGPADVPAAAAPTPKGILKHASGVGCSRPPELTPQKPQRAGPPGSDAALAADVAQGGSWPPLTLGAAGLQPADAGAPSCAAADPPPAVELTPGPAVATRGNRMLASVQQTTPVGGEDGDAACQGRIVSTPCPRLSAQQQHRPAPPAGRFRRGASRGHRLLAALQQAATAPSAAAADAARLIVDPAAAVDCEPIRV
jgi:hypothetical protein